MVFIAFVNCNQEENSEKDTSVRLILNFESERARNFCYEMISSIGKKLIMIG